MGQAPHAGDAPEEEIWAQEAGISHEPAVENRQNTQLAEATARRGIQGWIEEQETGVMPGD